MKTIWKIPHKQYGGELKGYIKRDIVVIGGGIAGILTAYQLSERGHKVTLIEAETLYSGVTENTTAHIEALQGLKYSELIKKGLNTARLYYNSQMLAIENYEMLIEKYQIDCDFKKAESYLFGFDKEKITKEYKALNKIGAEPELIENFDKFGYKATAVKLYNQAIFHPLKFLEALPKNFEIFENSRIKKVDTKLNILYTEQGSITAEKIIIATNFPIINFPGLYFIKMYKSSSYAVGLKIKDNIDSIYQSASESGLTFRGFGKYIIAGGLDHRTGRVDSINKYKTLEDIVTQNYPEVKSEYRWSANDCITFDSLPFAGYYSKSNKNIFVISGFNKWGMTNSMICSLIIADLIDGKKNKFAQFFSPLRCYKGISSFLINSAEIVKNIMIKPIIPPFKTIKSLSKGSGDIICYKGKKRAVYMDEKNELHIIKPYCAHLKCLLKFNYNDKTWDCPCHGSRYDIDGNIINAPTVQNQIKY